VPQRIPRNGQAGNRGHGFPPFQLRAKQPKKSTFPRPTKNRSSKSHKKRTATKAVLGQADPLRASPLPKDSLGEERLAKSTRPVAASAHKSSRPALFS